MKNDTGTHGFGASDASRATHAASGSGLRHAARPDTNSPDTNSPDTNWSDPKWLDPAHLATAARDRRVLIGVTGGIAAYKACTVVSRLAQAGAHVTVLMTENATRFVTPLTFQALSGRHVYTSAWEHVESQDPQHIRLATSADACLIAPCTMDCMARLASGMTSDVVTLVLSAVDRARTPVLLAPAMNAAMWAQPSTQRNLALLISDGFHIVGPGDGWQACRTSGAGRMSEPETLLGALAATLATRPARANA
jgi:phosphopantothenoylcysteine decarboxylase/phosphopantothenate--cysteine ligase